MLGDHSYYSWAETPGWGLNFVYIKKTEAYYERLSMKMNETGPWV